MEVHARILVKDHRRLLDGFHNDECDSRPRIYDALAQLKLRLGRIEKMTCVAMMNALYKLRRPHLARAVRADPNMRPPQDDVA